MKNPHKLCLFLVAIGALLGGCASDAAYLRAVSSFASTTTESLKVLSTVPGMAEDSCRKQSGARYLKRHLLAVAALEADGRQSIPLLAEYFSAPDQVGNSMSWQDYCAEIEKTGKNYTELLALLTTYANAMKALASQGSWDGASLKDLANNLAGAVGKDKPLGQTLSGASSSAQALGSKIMLKHVQHKTHEFAADADGDVQAILAGLGRYLQKLEVDVFEPGNKERQEAVKLLEAKSNVWSSPTDTGRIAGFVMYAQSVDGDVEAIRAALQDYQVLIGKLKEGHAKLAKQKPDVKGANVVAAAATELLPLRTLVNKCAMPGETGK
jgi:hypothetical protein